MVVERQKKNIGETDRRDPHLNGGRFVVVFCEDLQEKEVSFLPTYRKIEVPIHRFHAR